MTGCVLFMCWFGAFQGNHRHARSSAHLDRADFLGFEPEQHWRYVLAHGCWNCGGGGCVGVWMAVVLGITATQMQEIALVNHITRWFCFDG